MIKRVYEESINILYELKKRNIPCFVLSISLKYSIRSCFQILEDRRQQLLPVDASWQNPKFLTRLAESLPCDPHLLMTAP